VYLSRTAKRRLWIVPALILLAAPGWEGRLVPVPHAEILMKAQHYDADDVFGAVREGEREGEQWHAEYMGSSIGNLLAALNLRGLATRLVPPLFVAHVPPGADDRPQRADAYFRVESSARWPWWWPGGGVRWELPSD
jgi:hypothetical protein